MDEDEMQRATWWGGPLDGTAESVPTWAEEVMVVLTDRATGDGVIVRMPVLRDEAGDNPRIQWIDHLHAL